MSRITSPFHIWNYGQYSFKDALEELYAYYDRPEHIHPDPLEFVYRYKNRADREVAGFVASALAYGRVRQILFSVGWVLDKMGSSPSSYLLENQRSKIEASFSHFKHRFTTGSTLGALLGGVRRILLEYGSLESCFRDGFHPANETVLPALSKFVEKINVAAGRNMPMFIPSPLAGSACKRLNLFMRWMVRKDNVDPGVWRGVSPSLLVAPLDTHMHGIALAMGLTARRQADLKCAVEVTGKFAHIRPDDPVRYDFALTRPGIQRGEPPYEILSRFFSLRGSLKLRPNRRLDFT